MPTGVTPQPFAWTAPGSMGLGSIVLSARPAERLSASTFWWALGERINRMIAAEDEADAHAMLQPVWTNDRLSIDGMLSTAGTIMAEASEWLHDRVYFPHDGVPADQLEHEPDTLERLSTGEDCLEEFIALLYRDSDWS